MYCIRWHNKLYHRIYLTSNTIEIFGIPGQFKKKNTKQDSQSIGKVAKKSCNH